MKAMTKIAAGAATVSLMCLGIPALAIAEDATADPAVSAGETETVVAEQASDPAPETEVTTSDDDESTSADDETNEDATDSPDELDEGPTDTDDESSDSEEEPEPILKLAQPGIPVAGGDGSEANPFIVECKDGEDVILSANFYADTELWTWTWEVKEPSGWTPVLVGGNYAAAGVYSPTKLFIKAADVVHGQRYVVNVTWKNEKASAHFVLNKKQKSVPNVVVPQKPVPTPPTQKAPASSKVVVNPGLATTGSNGALYAALAAGFTVIGAVVMTLRRRRS